MKRFIVILAAVLAFAGCKSKTVVDTSVEGELDIDSFLGEWYEIARFDYSYERGMTKAKAIYAVRGDGVIEFLNTGIVHGEPKYAKGAIKLSDEPRRLRLSFWGPFYSDYRVFLLDKDYQWALVGGNSDKYLWIISRTPELPETARDTILNDASRRGFDIGKLVWVEQ